LIEESEELEVSEVNLAAKPRLALTQARDPRKFSPTSSKSDPISNFSLPTTIDNNINNRHQLTMAAERKEKSGIAVGLNKGHV
jgi:hypothetical protein